MKTNIKTTYMGLELPSPIVASSSGITEKIDNIRKLEDSGVGAVVLKSLFEEEIVAEMNRKMLEMQQPGPMFPENTEMEKLIDTENGVASYLRLIRESKEAVDIPVIASVNAASSQKWTYFTKSIEEQGADGIELNVFLMPSDFEASSVVEFEETYLNIIRMVREQVSIPVAIKLSPYFTLLGQSLKKISESGVAGMVLFNRFFSPDYDVEEMRIVPTNVLSTPSDLALSLRWIAIMSGRAGCDLAASTGVHDGDAVIKQLLAGAQVVQVASALYKSGMDTVSKMLSRLSEWMEAHEFEDLAAFRGRLNQQNVHNPAAYDRVQFVKNYRSMGSPW